MLQTTLIDMEWNTKWDCENLDIFSSKGVTFASPKRQQATEELDGWSFNRSGVVNVENNSSTKSSISASTESSYKDRTKVADFSFEGSRSFHNTYNKKEFAGGELNGSSPSLEGASVCSSDQSIGLKLGKRTYFENGFANKSNAKTSLPNGVPPALTVKKVKLSHSSSTTIQRCQVEGCNLDLSSAKEYHRKHRVCENHSKSLNVVVAGLDRRFCQQCSRFHGLPEFDGKKRSCRRRLSDHNARRRKPQQETIQFNSTSLSSSSFYDGPQQLSFVYNVPLVQTKPAVWETSQHSVKAEKPTIIEFSNAATMPTKLAFKPSKVTTAGVFDQGSNAEVLDLRRALSLLSNNSWSSRESDFSGLDHHPMHTNGPTSSMPQHREMHSDLQPDYWLQVDQQSVNHPNIHATTEFQELKAPYEIQYVNTMDEILKPL